MAFAWGDLGHQTVGEIAQRNLTPKGNRLVEEILGHGPMAEAATFPDLVRSDEDFTPSPQKKEASFSDYHFIEIDPRFNGSYELVPDILKAPRDANSMISNIPGKLMSGFLGVSKFTKNQKMDLMRYLIHLVGDVHQPLHVGNGYDRGANMCNLKYSVVEDGVVKIKSTNFHSFWDSTLVDKVFANQKIKDPSYKMPGWKGFKELADLIVEDQKALNTDEIKNTPVLDWYKESQSLHSKVYIDSVPTAAADREYCGRLVKGADGVNEKDARGVDKMIKATGSAEATEDYMKAGTEIVKSQLMKAGLRLAQTINTMAEKEYVKGTEDYESKKIGELKELLVEFENTK